MVHSDYPELGHFTVYTGKNEQDTMEAFCNLILEISTNTYHFYTIAHTQAHETPQLIGAGDSCEGNQVLFVWGRLQHRGVE